MKALYDLGLAVGLLCGVGSAFIAVGIIGVCYYVWPGVFVWGTMQLVASSLFGAIAVGMAIFADTHYKEQHIPRRILEAMKRGE